jgi:hypothetical protein
MICASVQCCRSTFAKWVLRIVPRVSDHRKRIASDPERLFGAAASRGMLAVAAERASTDWIKDLIPGNFRHCRRRLRPTGLGCGFESRTQTMCWLVDSCGCSEGPMRLNFAVRGRRWVRTPACQRAVRRVQRDHRKGAASSAAISLRRQGPRRAARGPAIWQ